ncbi:hypothetical protein CASFOL_038172 [Castilleja foliolosa]|uniref:Uncharacterized protein n=1 Tax=Castilleja foliolosa TaxID=1961234 RepID=A0ABD3BL63_9LAMI
MLISRVEVTRASDLGHFDNALPSKVHVDDDVYLWRNANVVCFDLDSKVCLDEGIDELAECCGAGEAVAEWTARLVDSARAMNGSARFEQALAARLSLLTIAISVVVCVIKYVIGGGEGLLLEFRFKETNIIVKQ